MKYIKNFKMLKEQSHESDENLEGVALKLYPPDLYEGDYGSSEDYNKDVRNAFKAGAKWQSEKMYTEEDMKQFGLYLGDNLKNLKGKTIDEIFEEFIK
jgi:hypothetical protein